MDNPTARPFDIATFHRHLETAAVGRSLIYRESAPSTMDVARREAEEGAPHGTLVFAEEQTAGRGRKGRSFYSPARQNLYVTFVLKCVPDVHRRLPLIVPLAVCEALLPALPEARIKWPNDIWAGVLKVSGMLIDGELGPAGPVAFPGIGVNVNGDPSLLPELAGIATSVARETGREVGREALLATLCNHLESSLAASPDHVGARYRALSNTVGARVRVEGAHGAAFEGLAVAIDGSGALTVRRDDGVEEAVTAAEVSIRPLEIAARP